MPLIVTPDDDPAAFAGTPHEAKLKQIGEIRTYSGPRPVGDEALLERIRDATVSLNFRSSTVFSRNVLGKCPNLKLISVCGIGYDNVDAKAAGELGITVTKQSSNLTLVAALRSPEGAYDSRYLTNLADITVVPALKRLDGVGSEARFNYPAGVAADSTGNVYVADSLNATIRKIAPGGVVSTLAGSPGIPGYADGLGADARFNAPQGLAVDAVGNVYVADSSNHVIRIITPAGAVSTLAITTGTGSIWYEIDVARWTASFPLWQLRYFSTVALADPSLSGPAAKPDGDGVANLLKYYFGLPGRTLAPANSLPTGALIASGSQQYLALTYLHDKLVKDVDCVAEVSSDLVNWVSGPAATRIEQTLDLGAQEQITVRDLTPAAGGQQRFMRLRFQQH